MRRSGPPSERGPRRPAGGCWPASGFWPAGRSRSPRQPERLAGGGGGHAGRADGDDGYFHRQCLAASDSGRDRGHPQRGDMGQHRLSGGRDHRHSADRLAGAPDGHATAADWRVAAVYRLFDALRLFRHPWHDDLWAAGARAGGRGADPHRPDHHRQPPAALATIAGAGADGGGGAGGAGAGAGAGRLADRQYQLALCLLHERADLRGAGGAAGDRRGCHQGRLGRAARGGLAGHRRDHPWPWRADHRAGRGQPRAVV